MQFAKKSRGDDDASAHTNPSIAASISVVSISANSLPSPTFF